MSDSKADSKTVGAASGGIALGSADLANGSSGGKSLDVKRRIRSTAVHPVPRPADVSEWTIDHVAEWIRSLNPNRREFESYAAVFRTNGVDGSMLLHDVTESELTQWVTHAGDQHCIRESLIIVGSRRFVRVKKHRAGTGAAAPIPVPPVTLTPGSGGMDILGVASKMAATGGAIYMNFGTAGAFGTGAIQFNHLPATQQSLIGTFGCVQATIHSVLAFLCFQMS